MSNSDWSLPRSHRKTRRANMMGGRVTGVRNRLIKPCPNCGARRYEKCFIMKTIYVTPREYYPFYMETVHSERLKESADSLDSLTQVGGE
jgi:hypothetical protein